MFERFARLSFWPFGRGSNQQVIDRLHGEIVAAARNPALFITYGVEDTFEGRFETVVLHACLVLRRLRALPSPAPDMAQDLTDALFRHFEVALREVGVGDGAVPKRMKGLAEAFLGRSLTYEEALRASDGGVALAVALRRNVYAERTDGAPLASYVRDVDAALAAAPLDAFINGPVPFPAPAAAPMETLP